MSYVYLKNNAVVAISPTNDIHDSSDDYTIVFVDSSDSIELGYGYDEINKVFIKPDSMKTLDELKSEKIAELTQARDVDLQTFKSSALGSVHTYLADERSMIYLSDEVQHIRSVEYDGTPSSWYTQESGFVDHTADQIIQVHSDGRAHVRSLSTRIYQLEMQVLTATTADQVSAIKWS
jgi:hypothetical protein